jgi:hypothetical protein
VRQFSSTTAAAGPAGSAGYAAPGQVIIDPSYQGKVNSVAARLGKRGRMSFDQLDGLRTMMHEALHQMRFGRDPGVVENSRMNQGGSRWFEEGATEAITQDLLPIFARQMYGDSLADKSITVYDAPVRNVRQLSVFGSGSKNAQDYKARVWRRSFLHADANTRRDMVAKAQQARVVWGQKAGR